MGRLREHDWLRGVCRLGVLPCNGMIYVPPNGCNCCVETYLRGFLALNSTPPSQPYENIERLQKGPAFDSVAARSRSPKPGTTSDSSQGSQWAAFRHDSARSSGTPCCVTFPVREGWSKKFPGPVTSSTVVDPTPSDEGSLTLGISTSDGQVDLFGFDLSVVFDPARFEFTGADSAGGLFGDSTCAVNTDDPETVVFGCISSGGNRGPGLIAGFSFDYQGGEPSLDDFEISSTFFNDIGAPVDLPGLDFTIDLN